MLLDYFIFVYLKCSIFNDEYQVRYRDDTWEKVKELFIDFDKNLFAYMMANYFYKQLNLTSQEKDNFQNLQLEKKKQITKTGYLTMVDKLW